MTQDIAAIKQGWATLIPTVKRKPGILVNSVLGSRDIQLSLLLVLGLLLLPLLLPLLLDPVLEWIFPPVDTRKLFGIIRGVATNPHYETARIVLRVLLWSAAVGVSGYLLWLRLPSSLHYARQRADTSEQEGDQLLEQDPTQSILHYHEARRWAADPEHEDRLSDKIASVNIGRGTAPPAVEKTLVIPADASTDAGSGTVAPGNRLIDDRYEIKTSLGEGAMGVVYLAHDQRLGRDIAIKQLSPGLMGNTEFLSRFRQEARALGRLIHPNIVQVFDFIEKDNQAWIAMEYVDGEGLDGRLGADPLPLAEVLELSLQIATAMAYAHEQGVIHRDLKPANILVTTDGTIKIMDFGVAKMSESSMMTQVGTIMGSPAFMSPEQASGKEIDNSTDIYALGIMMYGMLCGELPFTGDTQSVIAQHLTRTPDSIALSRQDIPEALDTLIMAMLEKDAGNRPQGMQEIVGVLESLRG